jgi:magnesium transporter
MSEKDINRSRFDALKGAEAKSGEPPGTLRYTGQHRDFAPFIEVFEWNKESFSVHRVDDLQSLPEPREGFYRWVKVVGVHNVKLMEAIAKAFSLHPLIMEDILNPSHRPKLEELDGGLFIMLHDITYNKSDDTVHSSGVSIVHQSDVVLSFQELEHGALDFPAIRIRAGRGRLRKMGTDYLTAALMDAVTDRCFPALLALSDTVDQVEELVLGNGDEKTILYMHRLQGEIVRFRSSIRPVPEMITKLSAEEVWEWDEKSKPFFRDVHDHAVQAVDTLRNMRESLTGLQNLYISLAGLRMNRIMQFLTIVASVFIPLTFLAGLYGMNFHNMPELSWKYGYPVLLGIMAAMAGILIYNFKRKKWL